MTETADSELPARGTGLFLRRWLANPLRMGSVIPSSPALCARVVCHGWPVGGGLVLELGAGTGVIARAFLKAGLPPERLILVEIDPELARHLRTSLPGVTVLERDARDLPACLPSSPHAAVETMICGIPLVLLPLAAQLAFVDPMLRVAPARGFLHYSYCMTSPLPARRLGLYGKRVAWTSLNFPPASLWHYRPAD